MNLDKWKSKSLWSGFLNNYKKIYKKIEESFKIY